MTTARTDAVPPPIPAGSETTRSLRDAPRLAQLSFIRFTHGTRRATGWTRLFLGYLTLIAAITWPLLLLPWRAIQLRHPAYVTYVHRDRRGRIDASLVIKPTSGPIWTIADHITRHPGTGAGRHLRDQLLPHLLAVADEHGITVRAVAATSPLAELYRRTVPGLTDIGPARPFGRRLERRPRPTKSARTGFGPPRLEQQPRAESDCRGASASALPNERSSRPTTPSAPTSSSTTKANASPSQPGTPTPERSTNASGSPSSNPAARDDRGHHPGIGHGAGDNA